LSHISAVDGIYHVVRAFPNEEILHNDGEVDPIRDIETINFELRAKDLQALDNIYADINTRMKRSKEKKKEEEEIACIDKVKAIL
jgi:obg-like ATPase 1